MFFESSVLQGYNTCITEKNKKKKSPKKRYAKSKWKPDQVTFPGKKVQINIKYVPRECLAFNKYGIRYYQITAIDEYSRKRHCKIVDEESVTHTARFLLTFEKELVFNIHTVQTDKLSSKRLLKI